MAPLPDLSSLITEVESRAGGGGGLPRITAAEEVAAELDGLGARLVGYVVEQARAGGNSWAEIGTHLGISKQAAQQRYSPQRLRLTVSDLADVGLLARFTPRARGALVRAEQHARRLGAAAVDPRHLLLAVLDDPGTLAVQALDGLGVDRAALRAELDGAGSAADASGAGPLAIGAGARRVLEAAVAQALRLDHNYVGTEHLLLGLVSDRRDAAGRLLAQHGATRDGAATAVRDAIDAYLRSR